MQTNVFISWSGEQSRGYAEAIREWLPSVLQHVSPYFSPEDIAKGTKWESDISVQLEKSHAGIICLTNENVNSPWINFEAGALSKSITKSRVCTILFNVEPVNVSKPLSSLQHTRFTKDDLKKLVRTINLAGDEFNLDAKNLELAFDRAWPDLERTVDLVSKNLPNPDSHESRSDRELLEEILELARMRQRISLSSRPAIGRTASAVKEMLDSLIDMGLFSDLPIAFSNDIVNVIHAMRRDGLIPKAQLTEISNKMELLEVLMSKPPSELDLEQSSRSEVDSMFTSSEDN